jgi:hypothetical protein
VCTPFRRTIGCAISAKREPSARETAAAGFLRMECGQLITRHRPDVKGGTSAAFSFFDYWTVMPCSLYHLAAPGWNFTPISCAMTWGVNSDISL